MKDVQSGYGRFATIVALGLLAGAMPLRQAAAESVRDACTHDAFRLCSNTIPNVGRTKACLARHRSSLSPQCQAAFAGRSKHERSAERSAREHPPERSAKEGSPERSAQEASPERSAQEASPERSAQEGSPERSAPERRHTTPARHYASYRHYRRHRGFFLFPFLRLF
jgi:hypothetical protein